MLSGLLQTMIICMGMSLKGMPLCDYKKIESKQEIKQTLLPKKATTQDTVVQNYTLDIGQNNYTQQENNIDNNWYSIDARANLANNNAYLNVLGNMYTQSYYQINGATGKKYVNTLTYENYYNNENDIYVNNINKMSYFLKITPYNYNVETQIRVRIYYNINPHINVENLYSKYRVYTSLGNKTISGNLWDNYVGRNLTRNIVNYIEEDINDPNNNFYYSLDTYIDEIGTESRGVEKYFDITITPNVDNYVYIVITPIVELQEYYGNAELIDTNGSKWVAEWWNPNNIRITGTNIIPPSTYEVIDLPGLMFEILGMPFAFMSQAFNVTLFPGTPYQINISNLFISILALLIFIFLIKLIVSATQKGG